MAFCSIAICLFLKSVQGIYLQDNQLIELWSLKSLVANFFLLFAGYPYFEMLGINNPLWYLCILIQCYVLYYIINWIADKFDLKTWILYSSMLLCCVGLWRVGWINVYSFRGITSFLIGTLLCNAGAITAQTDPKKRRLLGYLCLAFAAASLSLGLLGVNQRLVLVSLTWPAVVFGCFHIDVKEVPIISKAGKVSFEVYVWHYPLMVLTQLVCDILAIQIQHSYFSMLLFLIFVWIVGWMTERFVEKPINRMVRRFTACNR